ncbi:MAG: hypothetical protein NT085_03115 [candidate division SR1 bacterium]|nr:hypothetical protein [candidate division SR1 bacterium]
MANKNQLKIVIGKDSITLFEDKYFKNTKSWFVPIGFHGILCEVDPGNNSLAEIVGCIEADRENNKADQIDHLRINNRTASCAYLEGLISKEAFDKAEVNDDYIQITCELLKTTYSVRIYPENSNMIIGTYTKEGTIV